MHDFEIIALSLCAVFGWTLPEVFALTVPQFFKASSETCRLQYQRAKNEVFFGVCAAIGGGEAQEDLFKFAGSSVIDEKTELPFTEEELRMAEKRMNEIQEEQRRKQEAENV